MRAFPCVVAVAMVSTGALLAQTAPPPQKPDSPQTSRAVFRSSVDYVQLNAVVTDAKGKPVTDLTRDEFQILDEDQPQTIGVFERVTIPASHRVIDSTVAGAPPPADVATNPPPSRAFVFVIDDGTIEPQRIVPLKTAMKQFLSTMSSEDRVAVVFARRSDLGQDFTMDVGRLLLAVQRITAAVQDITPPIGGATDSGSTRITLEHVISTLSEAPEARRAIVFVSSGQMVCGQFSNSLTASAPWADRDCTSAGTRATSFTEGSLQSLINQARDADVPIYVIDPNGLRAPELGLSGNIQDQTPQARMALDQMNVIKQNFGRTLAENTGGLAFVNTSIYSAADAVLLDNSTYYVLGYAPSSLPDRRLHEIRVKVTRPGLRVRSWKRYSATPKPSVAADPGARLLAAVADTEPRGELGLRAFAAPVWPGADGTTTIIRIDVSYPAVDAPRPDDTLSVVLMAVDVEGKIKKSRTESLPLATSKMPAGAATVSVNDTLDLPEGQWSLRVGVSSAALGTTGTAHLPIEIPKYANTVIAATPLVIGYADRAPVLVGAPEVIAPLIPLQPTTQRVFSSADRLRVFSRVFAEALDSVKTELKLKRGNDVLKTMSLRVTPTSLARAQNCETTVTLTDLKPGAYVLEFTAKAGRDQVVRAVGITVK